MINALRSVVAGAVAFAAVAGTPATAQTAVRTLNDMVRESAAATRSDPVLLPAIASMDPAPRPLADLSGSTLHAARLLGPASSDWSRLVAWAMDQPQRDALDALARATECPPASMSFSQPYGAEDVDPALVVRMAYTELGDPPLLAGARFGYLDHVRRLEVLVQVEATRLIDEGRPGEALDLLRRLVWLGRQLLDRPLHDEVRAGYELMIANLERMRDVAYGDFKGPGALELQEIKDAIDHLAEDPTGVWTRALRFPGGNLVAAQQVFELTYDRREGPRESVFAPVMARLTAGPRPLRLFAEAARWEALRASQAPWAEMREAVAGVSQGWSSRWPLSPFDEVMGQPTPFEQLDMRRFGVIRAAYPDMGELFRLRQVLLTELAGTRGGLGVVGFRAINDRLPPQISSVRPQWIDEAPRDPMHAPPRFAERSPEIKFFVPVRDDFVAGPTDTREPHEMLIVPERSPSFRRTLFDDDFVIYSVGPDGQDNSARQVTAAPDARGSDYLLFPPMISLERQFLREAGRLR